MDTDSPYIFDPWENSVVDPMRTLPDVISDLIKTVYNKALKKQEDNDLSDSEAVLQDLGIDDIMYGNALFIATPSQSGVSNPLEDYNYWLEIPFKFFDEYDYFGPSYFIGATDHLTTWRDNYFAVESAVNNDYVDYYGGLIDNYISDNNITDYVLKFENLYGSNYPYMDYYTGSGGVLSHTATCFTYQYTIGGNRIVRNGAYKQIVFGTKKFGINIVDGMKQVVSITGSGNIPYLTDDRFFVRDTDDSFFFTATDNTNITNTYITNVDNSVQYHNTYTYNYDGDDITINYGDNYVVIPRSGDGMGFDDWRTMLLPIIDDLNINGGYDGTIVFPTFEDIKYGDMGSFYITPVKQIDKLPLAPDVGDTVPDISNYLTMVGGAVTSLYNMIDGLGFSLMLTFTFLICLVINHLKKE